MNLEQLGPYKLGRKLGRGGMGTVYAAKHVETGEEAAIKVLSVGLSGDQAFRDRFDVEIETLKKLEHPNIVRLIGFGEQDDVLYYVMELVEGVNLEEELRNGRRFNWRETIDIAVQCCAALKHAHDRGVIHRDIKPANLMLRPDQTVKLSDFGIAKLFGNSGMTADGGVIGTAEFMAPEQADGRPVTSRCDLYSLGSVLYALLAGRPPFRANSLLEMLQLQRFAEPEALRRHCPDVPSELETLILQLLAKDPDQRPPNAQVLSRRLQAMRHGITAQEERRQASPPRTPNVQFDDVDPHAATSPGVDDLSPSDTEASGYQLASPEVTRDVPVPLEKSDPYGMTVDTTARPSPARTSARPTADASQPTTRSLGSATAAANRFTTLAEEKERRAAEEAREQQHAWVSPQTWILAVTLLLCGLLAWWFLRPPSAEKLYAEIAALAETEDPEALKQAEGDIRSFLDRFPNDERCPELQGYLQSIDLGRRERLFELRRKGLGTRQALSSVERLYFEAMSHADTNPTEAVQRLEALVALFGDSEEDSASGTTDQQCAELARRQLERLRKEAAADVESGTPLLTTRLEEIEQLSQTDPAAAHRKLEALITLYAGKQWAEPFVEQATQMLAQLPPPEATESQTPAEDPGPPPSESAAAQGGAPAVEP